MESVRWFRRVSLGILPALVAMTGPSAWASPEGPAEPAAQQPAKPASAAVKAGTAPSALVKPTKAQPAPKPVAAKPAATKSATTRGDAEAAPGWEPPAGSAPNTAGTVAKKGPGLKLAPSAAEIESERQANGNAPQNAQKPRDPREGTPNQDQRFPTHVDYTRGPGSPLGGGTAGDRKATVQDASGPQTGVVRNHW